MLTFEDFFKKKRIDLQQLQQAEPALFAEFSRHYPLMGEKSFDHTKKYWFNNLRRTYPLATEVKPHAVKAEDISEMAIQGIAAAAAQNLNQTLEKPKFTEDHLAELVEKNIPEQDVSLAEAEKSITEKPQAEFTPEPETENPQPATELAKPAFKPKFNPKTTNKPEAEIKAEPATENPQPATDKAYKPRFQMKNTPKPATETPPPAAES